MFTLFRQDENGDPVAVATLNDREAAERLAKSLAKLWTAKYTVEETESDDAVHDE